MMTTYKNDPNILNILYVKISPFLKILSRLELSKSARTTKTKNHTFDKFSKSQLKVE